MDEAREVVVERAGDAGTLAIRNRRLPPPGPGEVRVRIEAAGVAYADIVMRRGLYPGQRPPVTPGYDMIGRIETLGAGVDGLSVGQRVAAVTVSGSYASHRNVAAELLVPAPEQASAAALAAATLNGLTAWQMLHRLAQPAREEWILVHGAAGGVGTLLLDLARVAGLRAIGSASKAKLRVVADRGGVPLDYADEDVPSRARALSGTGVAAAFDHIGGSHVRRQTLSALRRAGTGVVYGGYDATRGGKLRPFAAANLILNAQVSAYRLFTASQTLATYSAPIWRDERRAAYRTDLVAVLDLVASGAIQPLVGAELPLEQAGEAHRLLEGRSVAGKIVLIP